MLFVGKRIWYAGPEAPSSFDEAVGEQQ